MGILSACRRADSITRVEIMRLINNQTTFGAPGTFTHCCTSLHKKALLLQLHNVASGCMPVHIGSAKSWFGVKFYICQHCPQCPPPASTGNLPLLCCNPTHESCPDSMDAVHFAACCSCLPGLYEMPLSEGRLLLAAQTSSTCITLWQRKSRCAGVIHIATHVAHA